MKKNKSKGYFENVQEKTLELKEKKTATGAKPDIFLPHTLSRNEDEAVMNARFWPLDY